MKEDEEGNCHFGASHLSARPWIRSHGNEVTFEVGSAHPPPLPFHWAEIASRKRKSWYEWIQNNQCMYLRCKAMQIHDNWKYSIEVGRLKRTMLLS